MKPLAFGWTRCGVLLLACACVPPVAVRAEPVVLGPTLSRIARSGEVRVGYIPTPGTVASRNEARDTVGYSIELCLQVVERIRRSLDRPFCERVDATLLALMRSGEMEAGYRRWFDNDHMHMPMSVYMKENLRFPNKYGVP